MRFCVIVLLALVQPAAAQHPVVRLVDDGRELRIEYGPVRLPTSATHDMMLEPPTLTVHIPADGWMRGMDVELADEQGRPVPRLLLHHINAISPDARDLFSSVMLRVGAAGVETAPVTLPRILGLRVHRGDSLLITLMFHNPTDSSYDDVMLRVHIPFTPAASRIGALTVYPMSVAIGPKNQPDIFDLPPGRSEHIWEGSPAVPVRILGLSGHLHRYGVGLRFEDRTTGDVIWEARPTVDSVGDIVAMPVTKFVWMLGKPIRPDHVYRLTAIYENPTGHAISQDGMGVMGGLVRLTGGAKWPAVDRQDPDYQADVTSIVGGMSHDGMSHHAMP